MDSLAFALCLGEPRALPLHSGERQSHRQPCSLNVVFTPKTSSPSHRNSSILASGKKENMETDLANERNGRWERIKIAATYNHEWLVRFCARIKWNKTEKRVNLVNAQ